MRHLPAYHVCVNVKILSPIRLVCFDLGGVLVRICRSWQEVCDAAGFDMRIACNNGHPAVDGWQELSVQLGLGLIDEATWATRISELIDGAYSPDELRMLHQAVLLGEYDGVCEVIDSLHEVGIETAALSNTNHAHWEQLLEYPAISRLHHRHASHLLGLHKPDQAIYRAFEQHVNYRGNEILFFDDLPENVASAQAVGWNAVQIDYRGNTAEQFLTALQSHNVLP